MGPGWAWRSPGPSPAAAPRSCWRAGAKRTSPKVEADLGALDILVNNAAGNFVRPAEVLPEKAFANVVDIVLNGTFYASRAADRLWPSEELEERVRASIPLERFATREEVAGACAWLVSDAASYVTGECLTMDGGAWLGRGILGGDEPIPSVKRRRS